MPSPKSIKKRGGKEINSSRRMGKQLALNKQILEIVYEANSYLVFHGKKGIVHIIPDGKLREMMNKLTDLY